jgi:hypothetical protein
MVTVADNRQSSSSAEVDVSFLFFKQELRGHEGGFCGFGIPFDIENQLWRIS